MNHRIKPLKVLSLATLAGAFLSSGAGAAIFINEVDADQTGADTGEFIELYDGGVGNTPLDGYVLVLINGSNLQSYLSRSKKFGELLVSSWVIPRSTWCGREAQETSIRQWS